MNIAHLGFPGKIIHDLMNNTKFYIKTISIFNVLETKNSTLYNEKINLVIIRLNLILKKNTIIEILAKAAILKNCLNLIGELYGMDFKTYIFDFTNAYFFFADLVKGFNLSN